MSTAAAANPAPAPAADDAQAAGVPYLGSTISLISKSGIRYEGILYDINPVESTVALSNVRSFGTEGRRQGGPQVPATASIFDYIIFRGSDIQDLKVCAAAPVTTFQDPAIVSAGATKPAYDVPPPVPHAPAPVAPAGPAVASAPQPAPHHAAGPSSSGGYGGKHASYGGHGHGHSGERPQSGHHGGHGGHGGSGRPRGPVGTSDYLKSVRTRQALPGSGAIESADSEFDIQASMAKFDKEAELKKLAEPGDEVAPAAREGATAYNKSSSFFDMLTTDTTGDGGRGRRDDERSRHYGSSGGAGGGGNRGGRGGYRGGGGGGYRGGSRGGGSRDNWRS